MQLGLFEQKSRQVEVQDISLQEVIKKVNQIVQGTKDAVISTTKSSHPVLDCLKKTLEVSYGEQDTTDGAQKVVVQHYMWGLHLLYKSPRNKFPITQARRASRGPFLLLKNFGND